MKIWVIDVLDDPHYSFRTHWENFLTSENLDISYTYIEGLSCESYQHLPPLPKGVIISGSTHSVYEQQPWMHSLSECLRDLYTQDIPMLGICFGHQILAHALGGEVTPLPHKCEFGNHPVYLTPQGQQHPWLSHFPSGSLTLQSHQDQVSKLPAGAQWLAYSNTTQYQIFSLGKTLGIQFHPEYTPETLRIIAHSRKQHYLATSHFHSEEHLQLLLEQLIVTPQARSILSQFLISIKEHS